MNSDMSLLLLSRAVSTCWPAAALPTGGLARLLATPPFPLPGWDNEPMLAGLGVARNALG